VSTLPWAVGGSYSDGNDTLTRSPTFSLIVAPESDSTSVRDPVYVGVGDGCTREEKGETVAAGLADAVPTADTVAPGAGVEDDTRPLDFAVVAQAARNNSAIAVDDFSLMFL